MSELRVEGLQTLGRGPFDLKISSGECVALSGPSGAGKTLLLRAIADLDPHTGSVSLEGRSCGSFAPATWRRQVGVLPAESQWWRDVIGDHFAPGSAPSAAALAELGLEPDACMWRVARASTGERQRLALLRLLAGRPRVLLLDEPTANLDPGSAQRVEELLARYRVEHGASVLWVAHDRAQAARVAQRHLELRDGRLIESAR